jgi:hypothetical protein
MGAHATNCCSQHRHLRCIEEIHLKMLLTSLYDDKVIRGRKSRTYLVAHLKMGSYGETDVKTQTHPRLLGL